MSMSLLLLLLLLLLTLLLTAFPTHFLLLLRCRSTSWYCHRKPGQTLHDMLQVRRRLGGCVKVP